MIRRSTSWGAVVAVCLFACAGSAHAQAELVGSFVRYVAVGSDGTMICDGGGCTGHSMQYAENASDTPSCDLYTPGAPVETFTVQATPSTGIPMTLTNTSNFVADAFATLAGPTVSGRTITWTGVSLASGSGIRVDQTFEMQSTERFVRLTVRVTNTGTSALTDVYYLRNGDPDFGSCSIGFDFATFNDVRRQPPIGDDALTTARAGDRLLPDHDLVLGIGAHDARARVHNGGFENTDAAGEWNMPIDHEGMPLDEGVDIVFREPTLAAGASTTFEILYVWGRTIADVETRFDDLGFPTAPCTGVPEGAACTTSRGATGLCRSGRCCTGCWDGARCRSVAPATCGVSGSACVSCLDTDSCTTDLCAAGVCSHPLAPAGTTCNDGLFCTGTDTCNAFGACLGSGARCDDVEDCTVDSCDEALDRCTNAGRPESASCNAFGASGQCHASRCCTGCWDSFRCNAGFDEFACGIGGGACARCIDTNLCTSDICVSGACSNPFAPTGTFCDDGMFCTSIDSCDGSGVCIGGGGSRCDDFSMCTTDSCDEATDRCVFTPTSGCIISGMCVSAGTSNPASPCQVCDPARSMTAWSARAAGTECAAPACTSGAVTTRACDSSGTCVASAPMRCTTATCADTMTCQDPCVAGTCPSGRFCNTTTMLCEPLRGGGAACTDSGICASGHCADGVCCSDDCMGTCERCNLRGSEGTCQPIPAGTDPDNECEGSCNGASACGAGTPDAGPRADGGGPSSDGGTPVSDGGAMDRDGGAVVTPPSDDGGCGCSIPGDPRRREASVVLALVGLIVAVRRRRKR